jgi:hypothetical protein
MNSAEELRTKAREYLKAWNEEIRTLGRIKYACNNHEQILEVENAQARLKDVVHRIYEMKINEAELVELGVDTHE